MYTDACAIVSMMAGEENAEAYEQALVGRRSPFGRMGSDYCFNAT